MEIYYDAKFGYCSYVHLIKSIHSQLNVYTLCLKQKNNVTIRQKLMRTIRSICIYPHDLV